MITKTISRINAAIRFLSDAMPSFQTQLPGITNEGLLSLHELTHGVKKRSDWESASAKAKSVLGKSKKELLTALGYTVERLDNLTELLSIDEGRTTAVGIPLPAETTFTIACEVHKF